MMALLLPVFPSFLFAVAFFQGTAHACASRRTLTPLTPLFPSRTETDVVQRMVGDIQSSQYTSAGQGPVYSGDELRCTFDQSCCWRNGQSSMAWMKARGNPDNEKMQSSFSTTDVPNGDFLIASSEGDRPDSDKAQFISCKISCTASDITLRSRHWASRGVSLTACTLAGDNNQKKTCKSWPASNGVPDTVTLPGGDNTEYTWKGVNMPINAGVVIEAAGFTSGSGSVAMLDDIIVDFQSCSSSDAPNQGTSARVQATPAPAEEVVEARTSPVSVSGACTKIVCNFERNNPCSYADARSSGLDVAGASVPWRVVNGPFENKLTGIPKAAEGGKFAGAYLKPGDKAALVTTVNYPNDYVVRLNGYRATEGINLFGCCNDIEACPYSTTDQVQASDYREWKSASVTCPGGSKKLIFYAVNNGRNQGAVGLDNVQLLLPSSSTPDKATQSAC